MFSKWWMAGSSSRKFGWTSILASLLCVMLLAAGCSLLPQEDEEEELPIINPPKLSAKPEYEVKTGVLEKTVRGTGKMMSAKEEELYFTVDGKRIKEIYVSSGDSVEAGQLIAELDVSELESQLRQKRLQLRSEEIALIEILRDTTDKTSDEIEQAKINYELSREEISELEQTISKSKLTAPFSGTIAGLYMKKGDASKEYETVAVLADMSSLAVAVSLSADDLKKVAIGMEARVDINGAGQHKGTLLQLPNPSSPDGNTGTGGQQQDSLDNYVLIQLEAMPENVHRGTQLGATFIIERRENVTLIPLSTLRTITGRSYVQVVDPDGTKREVDVEVGQQTPTEVEIVKGLTPGQKVVGR
ncbi:efflux RND transporter periplasmic adaptor subunit [Paenibacillus senegalensis]|uniref:efflux RND transporter periplasmic adaptor subunit n=1 Tax=Paenibacillus senegalensis TaxID=1465766 RepID=UPI0002894DC0|nr:efflux RND transporter periplasmic adaptor subunit [Paenibacillus senegalensis]